MFPSREFAYTFFNSYLGLCELKFTTPGICSSFCFAFKRSSRSAFANVLRTSVLVLGIYLNERSRIDFMGSFAAIYVMPAGYLAKCGPALNRQRSDVYRE